MAAALLVYAGITALLFHNLLPGVATRLDSDHGDRGAPDDHFGSGARPLFKQASADPV
ncbi:MAG: hypothetical protein HY655_04195 [Acidobacteria bacterium]|nr:hypothetical protein [Acidobacteriota bacterium]